MIILEFLAFVILFPIAAYLLLLGIAWVIDFINDQRKEGES